MPEITRVKAQTDSGEWVPVGYGRGMASDATMLAARSVSRSLAISSPLYSRLVESIVDSVVTPGMDVVLEGDPPKSVRTAVDWLWHSGPTALQRYARDLVRTLVIDGELLLRPIPNPADGRLMLDLLNPDGVGEIALTQGFNNVAWVEYSRPDGSGTERLRVIQRSGLALSDVTGDIFYFRIFPAGFTASTGPRGLPLLTPALDHISALTEFAYKRVSILSKLATFYWEVKLEGMSQDQIDDFLSSPRSAPPEGGEVFGHNERVDWKVIVPEVPDCSDESELWVQFLAGTAGLAPEFIGVSRSRDVSTEAIYTALVHLSALQSEFISHFAFITEYAISLACARAVGKPSPPPFRIITTVPGTRMLQRAASAVRTMVDSAQRAVEGGVMTEKEARRLVVALLQSLGFEVQA